MLVVYDSLTGMAKSFAEKLGYPVCDIHSIQDVSNESVFLITRSIKFGSIPEPTTDFLLDFSDNVVGCAVTGDTIWGSNFGGAGKKIEQQYNIPLVHVFERQGFQRDIDKVSSWIHDFITNDERGDSA